MKKTIFVAIIIIALCIVSSCWDKPKLVHNGIPPTIEYLDEFNDIIYESYNRVHIRMQDSILSIKEKDANGSITECVYVVLGEKHSIGSKDSVKNLALDVYGYERAYWIVKKDNWDKFIQLGNKPDAFNIQFKDKVLVFTHRFISRSRYTFHYDSEVFWIWGCGLKTPNGEPIDKIVYYMREISYEET